MSVEDALAILTGKARETALDGNLVALLERHVGEINQIRETVQRESINEYNTLHTCLCGSA